MASLSISKASYIANALRQLRVGRSSALPFHLSSASSVHFSCSRIRHHSGSSCCGGSHSHDQHHHQHDANQSSASFSSSSHVPLSSRPPRVRYAPSPTGQMHLGALRTALYNYLFARQHFDGKFLLRIEDTDKTREVEGSAASISDILDWAGVPYDEGPSREPSTCTNRTPLHSDSLSPSSSIDDIISSPSSISNCGPYIQSHRLPLYRKAADHLLATGKAYVCFCTADRLARIREEGSRRGVSSAYDRYCLSLPAEEVAARIDEGESHVIRMLIPDEGVTEVDDVVRGRISFSNSTVDDQVLLKSDGYPTYHLASVVDDHHMGITHVIRGEEWLPSTPKHILLYQSFGWEPPRFAHLPLLLNDNRTKLSKRQGHASVNYYRAQGYLPEALINFVAFLGWTPTINEGEKEKEVFTLQELVKEFSLPKVHKAGAIVDLAKLDWLNAQHIRRLCDHEPEELLRRVRPLVRAAFPNEPKASDDVYLLTVLRTVRERVYQLGEVPNLCSYFFVQELDFESEQAKEFRAKAWTAEKSLPAAERSLEYLEKLPAWNTQAINDALNAAATSLGSKDGYKTTVSCVRYLVSGTQVGASLAPTLEVLGRELVLSRLQQGIAREQQQLQQ